MDYLVEMTLADSARPATSRDGAALIEKFVFPSLEVCKRLQSEGKVVAGGPVSGSIGIVLVIRVSSPQELDDLLTGLPIWARMQCRVTPFTTFDARIGSLTPRLAALKEQIGQEDAAS